MNRSEKSRFKVNARLFVAWMIPILISRQVVEIIFVNSLYNNVFPKAFDDVRLIDRYYGFEYDNDMYIKDSKIKNGTLLVVI